MSKVPRLPPRLPVPPAFTKGRVTKPGSASDQYMQDKFREWLAYWPIRAEEVFRQYAGMGVNQMRKQIGAGRMNFGDFLEIAKRMDAAKLEAEDREFAREQSELKAERERQAANKARRYERDDAALARFKQEEHARLEKELQDIRSRYEVRRNAEIERDRREHGLPGSGYDANGRYIEHPPSELPPAPGFGFGDEKVPPPSRVGWDDDLDFGGAPLPPGSYEPAEPIEIPGIGDPTRGPLPGAPNPLPGTDFPGILPGPGGGGDLRLNPNPGQEGRPEILPDPVIGTTDPRFGDVDLDKKIAKGVRDVAKKGVGDSITDWIKEKTGLRNRGNRVEKRRRKGDIENGGQGSLPIELPPDETPPSRDVEVGGDEDRRRPPVDVPPPIPIPIKDRVKDPDKPEPPIPKPPGAGPRAPKLHPPTEEIIKAGPKPTQEKGGGGGGKRQRVDEGPGSSRSSIYNLPPDPENSGLVPEPSLYPSMQQLRSYSGRWQMRHHHRAYDSSLWE